MQETRNFRKGLSLEAEAPSESRVLPFAKRLALWAALLLSAFLFGLIPTWLSERETARQRDAAQSNLRLSQLQNRLATASLKARRGEYEAARVATSDFFTDLRAEVDRRESGFSPKQREAVQPILNERDHVITLLARSDTAATERLTDLYLAYVDALNPPSSTTQ